MDGHEGHDMCSMNMLFNWQIQNVCVVFSWWHIRSTLSFIVSWFILFGIAAGYECLRAKAAELETHWAQDIALPESQTLLANNNASTFSKSQRVTRSALYALQAFLSLWIMLVFMTYNGYLMAAIILGAGVGHYLFGNGWLGTSRSIQCH